MKTSALSACAILAFTFQCGAQTSNAVVYCPTSHSVFTALMSSSNTVLMTNAQFRCAAGGKVFFQNSNGYQDFTAAELSSNVLAQIHLNGAQLAQQQSNLKNQYQLPALEAEQQRNREIEMQKSIPAKVGVPTIKQQPNTVTIYFTRPEIAPGSMASCGIGG
ncbi:MAG: hypothetical protein KGJ13_09255 [Patescibacteria group bacterium]|nr:hypothetical protein [Patescibacteria group bacterium]